MSLRRSEERFRRLVEQVTDYAIIGLDEDGTITSWNAGAERLKGYSEGQAVGQHFSIFYGAEDRAEGLPQVLLERARTDGHVEHSGWRLRRDGTRFWGNVIITSLRDDSGAIVGFVKVTQDLTARRRFDEARESFFQAFAHDFRTPVASIAGFAELLRGSTPDLAAELTDRIVVNARRLAAMADEFVEHTRLASEPLGERTVTRLRDVAVDAVRGLADLSASDRVELRIEDIDIERDRPALERVLVNLLSNALNYSGPGTAVIVEGSLRDERVHLLVRDRGRGIDERDLPHIFDEFQRGRLAQNDGGSGLGLSSVRRLVERLGGGVTIDSAVGHGTIVSLDLPQY